MLTGMGYCDLLTQFKRRCKVGTIARKWKAAALGESVRAIERLSMAMVPFSGDLLGPAKSNEGAGAMKQKYEIIRDIQKKTLVLREYAELDKDTLSPLCEETYELRTVETALSGGKDALVAALRTKNMYPPGAYAEKIADAVAEMFGSADRQSAELLFDDIELLNKEREELEAAEAEVDEEAEDIDDLLTEEYEDEYENEDEIKNINSLKVADDEYGDVEEEP
jgi:hypothetical protein